MDYQINLNDAYNEDLITSIFDGIDTKESTRIDYKYRIKLFLKYLNENGELFNYNSFLGYKRYLEQRGEFKITTKNKYLATAKILLKELNRRGKIPVDITQNIKSFKQNKKHKKDGLSEDEMSRVVELIRKLPSNSRTFRLKAMFTLLALQGLRQIEIIRLDAEDLDLYANRAFVQGKGEDDKEPIYLHPQTVEALKGHLRANKIGSGAVFKSLGNRQSERITTKTIRREIGKILEISEIEKTTHGFRHFFVTKLLSQFDVRDVRKFSRHKSLEMLIVYDDEIDIKHKSEEVFNSFSLNW